jgi:hypothetical protein
MIAIQPIPMYRYNWINYRRKKMAQKRNRRANGAAPNPAISFRMPVEVRDMLRELAVKNNRNDTQQMIFLIKGSHARTKA